MAVEMEMERRKNPGDTDTLRLHLQQVVDEARQHLQRVMDERDLRYEQRFQMQERALGAALMAQKEAVAAALTAAERAVTKAELAADKRFESVNEFRGQLADQAATLLSRTEAGVEFGNYREKLETLVSRIDSLATRIERSEAKGAGLKDSWGYLIGLVSLIGGLLAIAYAVAKGRAG
ncbi:MAG: hypothetical protein QOG85_75 [Gaiellaceae bacterium]|jgi:hypothetical protein|nr:hypothetical protein [Gaiellaceae bacterium]